MEVLRLARCYYEVSYNYNKKTSRLTGVVTEENFLIRSFTKEYKAQNIQAAEVTGIKYVIAILEQLVEENKISEDNDVIVYGSAGDIIEALKYGDMLKINNDKGLDAVILEFQWHKNWKLVCKQEVREEIKRISEEYPRRKNRTRAVKKEKTQKKLKVINIIPIRELIKGKKRQLIFFDLEMNCNEDSRKLNGCEIISIGAVKYKGAGNVEKEDMFYSLIKPTIQPILSETCKYITGLNQEEINSAESFNTVFGKLKNWVGDLDNTLFVSWSDGDIRAIRRDYEINSSADKELYAAVNKNYIDFQLEFSEYMLSKNRISLKNALKILNLDFTGHQHHAGYDALNLALVYEAYSKDSGRLAEAAISKL